MIFKFLDVQGGPKDNVQMIHKFILYRMEFDRID